MAYHGLRLDIYHIYMRGVIKGEFPIWTSYVNACYSLITISAVPCYQIHFCRCLKNWHKLQDASAVLHYSISSHQRESYAV